MGGNEEFQARLDRIQSGKGRAAPAGPSQDRFARQTEETVPSPLWVLPLALVLGAVAVVAGKAAAYHLLRNSPSVDPTTATIIGFGDALIVAYVLGQVLGFSRLSHRIATGLGMLATAALFQNLAHWAPGPMAEIFSEAWVGQAQAAAPANTVWLGGDYVALAPEPAPEPEVAPCPPPKAEVTILQTDNAKKTKTTHKMIAAPQADAETPCTP